MWKLLGGCGMCLQAWDVHVQCIRWPGSGVHSSIIEHAYICVTYRRDCLARPHWSLCWLLHILLHGLTPSSCPCTHSPDHRGTWRRWWGRPKCISPLLTLPLPVAGELCWQTWLPTGGRTARCTLLFLQAWFLRNGWLFPCAPPPSQIPHPPSPGCFCF